MSVTITTNQPTRPGGRRTFRIVEDGQVVLAAAGFSQVLGFLDRTDLRASVVFDGQAILDYEDVKTLFPRA